MTAAGTHSPVRHHSPRLNLVSELECGVCVDTFLEPSILECGHRFCSLCILTWHQTCLSFNCPLCRAESDAAPVYSREWSSLADAYVAARMLELRVKGFTALADEQESEREDRRSAWKLLATALEGVTPPSSPALSSPAEVRLARLEALAAALQLSPDVWRGEPSDENTARRETPVPVLISDQSARPSAWEDPTSRERGFALLERMRGDASRSVSTSVMGHPVVPQLSLVESPPPSPQIEHPSSEFAFSRPIPIPSHAHRRPPTPPQSPVSSWPSTRPSRFPSLSSSLEPRYPTSHIAPTRQPMPFNVAPPPYRPFDSPSLSHAWDQDSPQMYQLSSELSPSTLDPARERESLARSQWTAVRSSGATGAEGFGTTRRWWGNGGERHE